MKVVEESNNLVRGNVVYKKQCGIVLNAHSFKILSRLYSTPILAILRELGTNAAESHVRAGNQDIQFVVKLPNRLDPTFSIRDYGVGMSADTVYNVYANYMASDKRDTNEEGGYFGLGSKTPFCYTDLFNLTCYQDGECRRYVMALNEVGIPELNEFPPTSTDEPDGVEVSFTVKQEDFYTFRTQCAEAFKFFRYPPRVTGYQEFHIDQPEYLVKDTDSRVNGLTIDRESYVVMGDIGYPLEYTQFSGSHYDIIRSGIIIEIPMGGLNLVPSREAIEYTALSKATIQKACDEVLQKLGKLIVTRFDNCKSYWEACVLHQSLGHKFHKLEKYLPDFDAMTFHDKKVSSQISLPVDISRISGGTSRFKYVVKKPQSVTTLYVGKDCRFYIGDCRASYARIRKEMLSSQYDGYCYLIPEDVAEDVCNFLEIPLTDCIRTSTLPAVTINRTYTSSGVKQQRKYENVLEFDPDGSQPCGFHKQSKYWKEVQVDIRGQMYVYVEFYRNDIKNDSVTNVCAIIKTLKKCGIIVPTIYGVRKTHVIKHRSNWMPLSTFLGEIFKRLTASYSYPDLLAIRQQRYFIHVLKLIQKRATISFKEDNHPILQLLELAELPYDVLISAIDLLRKYGTIQQEQENKNHLVYQIKRRYRILELVDSISDTSLDANTMVEVINALDSTR